MQPDKIEWLLRNWRHILDVHADKIPKSVGVITPINAVRLFNETHSAINAMEDRDRRELARAYLQFSPGHPSVNPFLYERAKKSLSTKVKI